MSTLQFESAVTRSSLPSPVKSAREIGPKVVPDDDDSVAISLGVCGNGPLPLPRKVSMTVLVVDVVGLNCWPRTTTSGLPSPFTSPRAMLLVLLKPRSVNGALSSCTVDVDDDELFWAVTSTVGARRNMRE